MSALFRLLFGLMLCSALVACNSGKSNILNPSKPDGGSSEDKDPNTSDKDDIFIRTSQFVGYYIENPELNPGDYNVGLAYLQTQGTPPDGMEEGSIYEGLASFKFKPCQEKNLFLFNGYQREDGVLQSYQASATIDNTSQTFVTIPSYVQDISGYRGAYGLGGSDYITNDCITHTLAARGKLEVFPLNTTHFSEGIDDAVISFNTDNPRQLIWNYKDFAQRSKVEFITVSLIHKTALDKLGLFAPVYQAAAELAAAKATEEARVAAAQKVYDAASATASEAESALSDAESTAETAKAAVETAKEAVATAKTAVATAKAKVTALDTQKAAVDALEETYNSVSADPSSTPAEITAALNNWQTALTAYNTANLDRTTFEAELATAQATLDVAENNLSSAQNELRIADAAVTRAKAKLETAKTELASAEANLEAEKNAVTAAEAALVASKANYSPRLTEDVVLWQEVVAGSSTAFTLPEEVKLVKDDYYLLNLVAWSADKESNFVYYHSSHVFRADAK